MSQNPATVPPNNNAPQTSGGQPNNGGCRKSAFMEFGCGCGCGFVIAIVLVAFAALNLSNKTNAKARARTTACTSYLQHIGELLMMYAVEHNGNYPKANECREVLLKGEHALDEKYLSCPYGVEYRIFVNGENYNELDKPNETVIAICPHVHKDGMHVVFADGHVESVQNFKVDEDKKTGLPTIRE